MATPADKYRINALAKDLNVKSKDIIELIAAAGKGQKSSMTALSEEELSYVFEHYTQKNQVDIAAFFKKYDEKKQQRAREEAEKNAQEQEKAKELQQQQGSKP